MNTSIPIVSAEDAHARVAHQNVEQRAAVREADSQHLVALILDAFVLLLLARRVHILASEKQDERHAADELPENPHSSRGLYGIQLRRFINYCRLI